MWLYILLLLGEFKMQPEPSLVLSQLSQRQQSSLSNTGSLPLVRQSSPPPQNGPSANQAPLEAFSKAPEPSQTHVAPPQAADSQVSSTQHRQIKTQKRRIAPTSKVSVFCHPFLLFSKNKPKKSVVMKKLFYFTKIENDNTLPLWQ